jgi:hypothetical protein
LPIFLDGELPRRLAEPDQEPNPWRFPEPLQYEALRFATAREALARLQARIEPETEEFTNEATELKKRGCLSELQRQATLFMEHNLEQFEEAWREMVKARPLAGVSI